MGLKEIVSKTSFLVTNASQLKNLPFKVSFDAEKELSYPVTVTKSLINKLLGHKDDIDRNILSHMYL